MKKNIIFIALILIVILAVVLINISQNKQIEGKVSTFNAVFEVYKDKNLYGADVLTIINKAIDNNTANEVQKDKNGNYIENKETSLKVDLILLTKDEEGNEKEVTHPMETLEKAGLDRFIASFSLVAFKIEDIQYNDLGRISKITVKQLEI